MLVIIAVLFSFAWLPYFVLLVGVVSSCLSVIVFFARFIVADDLCVMTKVNSLKTTRRTMTISVINSLVQVHINSGTTYNIINSLMQVHINSGPPFNIISSLVQVHINSGTPYNIISSLVQVHINSGPPFNIISSLVQVHINSGTPYNIINSFVQVHINNGIYVKWCFIGTVHAGVRVCACVCMRVCVCVCVCVLTCTHTCLHARVQVLMNVTHINRRHICFFPVETDRPVQQCRSGQWVRLDSTDSGRLQHVLQHRYLPHLQR